MKLTKDGQNRLYGNVEYRARALCPVPCALTGATLEVVLVALSRLAVDACPNPLQLAPDGTWHSGGGRVILCPDETYVSGNPCVLTPSGEYVGSE